jgi:hypothetical protein
VSRFGHDISVNAVNATFKTTNYHFRIVGTFLEKAQIESVICIGRLEGKWLSRRNLKADHVTPDVSNHQEQNNEER